MIARKRRYRDANPVAPQPVGFVAGDWSITSAPGDGKLSLSVDTWTGGTPDGVIVSVNGGAWEPAAAFAGLPWSGDVLTVGPGEYSVAIRAVKDGRYGDISDAKVFVEPAL